MQVLIATGDPAEPFKPVEVSEAIESLAHYQVKFLRRLEALEKAPHGGAAAKLENAEDFREAIGVLAIAVTRLEEVQTAQGSLLAAMDARIQALTALLDHHQTILEKIGAMPPRPRGSNDVN